ncbi:hypothetical protein E4U54_008315 [Claviceps lovelessii]|nr:hypothetical protein E4U54_008315 [Claviceps lovelessii]
MTFKMVTCERCGQLVENSCHKQSLGYKKSMSRSEPILCQYVIASYPTDADPSTLVRLTWSKMTNKGYGKINVCDHAKDIFSARDKEP